MQLDTRFQSSRLGSISFLIPHVLKKELINPNTTREEMEKVSEVNMIKSTAWNKTDLLICTADRLSRMIDLESQILGSGSRSPLPNYSRINPAFLIFLDFECLFSSKEDLQNLRPILRHFIGAHRSDLKLVNQTRKVRT
jgi:hypothetical protein